MWTKNFLYNISESVEKQEDRRDNSESLSLSSIDDLEETLERKLREKSDMSRVMRCVGRLLKILIKWYVWLRNKDHEEWVWKNKIHYFKK